MYESPVYRQDNFLLINSGNTKYKVMKEKGRRRSEREKEKEKEDGIPIYFIFLKNSFPPFRRKNNLIIQRK